MPQISVIVPVYRVEPYIHRCVDSILRQTFTDFELILIDDGSPDGCGAICDAYAAQDRRVTVIHQANAGLSEARNAGIDLAMTHDSQWLSFVDSDDWVSERYLEALIHAAQGYDIAACGRALTDGEELPQGDDLSFTLKTPEALMNTPGSAFIVAWGKLYRKSDFQSIRYPAGKIHEDEFVTYRILFQYAHIPYIPTPLYAHYLNPEGIMRRPWWPGRLDVLEALEQQIAFYVETGRLPIAERIFHRFIKANQAGQERLRDYAPMSESEKRRKLRQLNRQLQRVLLRYNKYGWCRIRDRGKALWIWSDAFRGIRMIHMTWRWMKSTWSHLLHRS